MTILTLTQVMSFRRGTRRNLSDCRWHKVDVGRFLAKSARNDMILRSVPCQMTTPYVTNEQIMGLMDFAAMLRKDWDIISQDYESRRELLARLNIEVTLFVEDGQKKAKITGKVTAEEQTVSLENTVT